jgi:phosphate transport system permease protein
MSVAFERSESVIQEAAKAQPRAVRVFTADLSAVGEPFLWALGGALALGVMLVAGFLAMIFWNGATTFWPKPIHVVALTDGGKVAGEPFRFDAYRPPDDIVQKLPADLQKEIQRNDGYANRTLYRIGNYDVYNEDFRWVSDFQVARVETPANYYYFERQEWGPFVGRIAALVVDGVRRDAENLSFDDIRRYQREGRDRFAQILKLEKSDIGAVNHYINRERLRLRRAELTLEAGSAELAAVANDVAARIKNYETQYKALADRAGAIRDVDGKNRIILAEVGGKTKELAISQIVRFYPANDLSFSDKVGIYLSRWGEFLTSEPREANTEGGVLPAIFGTVAMTLMMVIIVAPFGVLTALYLREYARQGRLVAAVRIAVNNLAGVPSIVYGVFGLGFFAYTLGTTIDQLFYIERLPNPTFGTGGILWASLTLALLTVPVVIVASEEALSAVPRSMREGSLACGASKWQTIRYVVLPKALPGIMTGMILAMARGAGEVAPLMLVGVVKLAPELPVDTFAPFVHLERSFMHLGFHIFDVGFQSRNSEAGKPMVFVTTLLLLCLIVVMNSSAIYIRNRLKRKYATSHF